MEQGQGDRPSARSDEPEARSEVRWSARRKEGVVLRLLRGESLDLLARETGQPAARISVWREEFLAAGREGLKSRPRPEEDRRLVEALNVSRRLELPLARVCRVAGVSRSAACEQRRRHSTSEPDARPARRRPGPVGAMTDSEVLTEIRGVLADSPFVGEGHRKVWARLRRERGVYTSRKRVLRLTREAGLLAPTAQVRKRAKRLRDGTITVESGGMVDDREHRAGGEVWADASLRMDRWAAADLLREVTTERFGSVENAVAAGLALRYDGLPCFRSAHYQAEIDHLGIARSPAYHYEPETTGCIERFMGTLKEQVLWIEHFDTHEQLRTRVREFAATYNEYQLVNTLV